MVALSFPVAADIFGVSEPLACQVFNHVCRIMAASLFSENVHMPSSNEEWQAELRVSSKITSSHALENGMDSIFTQLQN